MTRLEFFKVEEKHLQDFLTVFVNGGEFSEKYMDAEGNAKVKLRVNKNRIYLGNNYSLSINQDDKTKDYWFSLDYLSADDRVKMSKDKKPSVINLR